MPELVAPPATDPAGRVHITGVVRTFPTKDGARTVLRDVNIDVNAGEIVAIVGPSGCGKSTLLRLIGGLDAPTAGAITLDDTVVHGHDDATAIAFQEPRLLPWRTIAQNVEIGLPRGTRGKHAKDRVAELLDLVGLSHAAAQRPREVSGGMAQRASLARALARSPRVLLLDEPFGALDALTRLNMHDLLLDIHRAQPTTIVLVTHDVEEALYLADRVLLLRNLITADAEPERPRARVVALGSTSGIGALGSAHTPDAYEEARAWALENPEETAQLLADAASIDPEVAQLVIDERSNLDVSGVPGDAQVSVLEAISPIIAESGDVAGGQEALDEAIATIVDDQFAVQATE